MAQFNADILLKVAADKALADIGKVERAVGKLQDTRVRLRVEGQREVDALGKSFKRLITIGRGLTAAGGLGTLALILRDINRTPIVGGGLDRLPSVVGAATKSLGAFTEAVLNAAQAQPGLAIGLTTATVAAIAFAPQISRAAKDTLRLAKAAAEAQIPLERAFQQAGLSLRNFSSDFGDASAAVDLYRKRIFELSETVSNLGRRQSALQNALNNTNSSSDTALKIAGKLVDITRRLNNEQDAQNDLLREAAGLQPQTVRDAEVSRRRALLSSRRIREERAQEAADALRNLRELEAAESAAARTRLAAAAAEKTQKLEEQARAAREANDAIRALERSESEAARARLASGARPVVDRRGAQASEFPFGPQQRTSGRTRFRSDVDNDRIDAAMIAAMRRRREAFYKWEAQQPRTVYQSWQSSFFAPIAQNFQRLQKTGSSAFKGITGSLRSGAIGGAFPLLFGQSGQAAVGGLIGGLLGGGQGGFAGSLVGTLIGDLQAARDRVRELGLELGFTSEQAKILDEAFAGVGQDSDKLEAAIANIRGIGLSATETASAIQISVELADEYGGKIDKITQAIADVGESGKVNIAALNKFTAQGIPIQDRLAEKFGVSRTKLLEMAKDGEISVQQLYDELTKLGIEAEKSANKGKTGFDRFAQSAKGLALAIADGAGVILKTLVPALDAVLVRLANIISEATRALSLLTDVQIGGLSKAISSSAGFRSIGFGSKTNIDAITKQLKELNPALAQNSDDIVKYRKVLENARVELSKYNGQLGEYSVNTAQRALSAAQAAVNARELALPKEPITATSAISSITAPSQLSAGGSGDKSQSRILALQEELRLAQQLAGINEKIRGAQFDEDRELQLRLQGEAQRAKLASDIAQVKLSDVPVAEKALQIAKLELDIRESLRDETLELAELERDRLRNFKNTIDGLNLELASANAITRAERDRLKIEKERLALRDNKDLTQDQKDQIIAAKKALLDAQAPLKAYRTELERSLTDTEAQIVRMAQTIETEIGSAMSSAITGVITGTQTVEQAMASMFENIGKAFIDMATQMIAKALILKVLGIFGGGANMGGSGYYDSMTGLGTAGPNFGLADGGPVDPNGVHLVGERGPELFVPGQSGMVVPNDIFDATRQALASSGGTDQAFSENSEALAVANSYTRERMFERERQTMLTGAGGSTTVQTQVINNVEYATIDQVQEVANLSAKRARAQVFSDMRNRPSTRASLGMG